MYLVCKGVNNNIAGDLIHNQERHIVGDEIVGCESIDVTFAAGDARPYREIDDGGDQPVEQIHDEIGAVLPLFCPVNLPKSLEDKEHITSLVRAERNERTGECSRSAYIL